MGKKIQVGKKAIASMAVALAAVAAVLMGGPQANAETISNVTAYTLGQTQNGTLTENGEEGQYYRFTLPSSGKIQVTGTAYMDYIHMALYDADAQELWNSDPHWNSTSEVIPIDQTFYLTSGTYYFCMEKFSSNRFGDYNFKIELMSSDETFQEINGGSNNSIDSANTVGTGGQVCNAQLALNDEKDFWKFTLDRSGKIDFNATFYHMEYVQWKLYDENGEELLSDTPRWNSTTENITVDEDLQLTKGTYYISTDVNNRNYGKYNFSLRFTSSNESYGETNGGSNNTVGTASAMALGKAYAGQLAINDEKDFYKFTIPSKKSLKISVNASIECVYIKLFDGKGNEIWSNSPSWNSVTNRISYIRLTSLERGTYYLAIQRYGSYGNSYTGNYTAKAEYLTQKNCPHETYQTSWKDATYFAKGYTLHRCEDCGYSYKTDYTPALKLDQGYLSSWSSTTGKGSLKLQWSTVSNASGYQIRYSKAKAMNKGVKTKKISGGSKSKVTIKKLSRKKNYYVQIRAFKKSGSKIVYGKWSSKMRLKTK